MDRRALLKSVGAVAAFAAAAGVDSGLDIVLVPFAIG